MEDLEFNQEKFQTLRTLFSEIAELQQQLKDKYKTKVDLENELAERKRIEEEFSAAKASLEEQLAKRESEMEVMANNLQSERQTLKQALDNLQQQFNTLYKL